MRLQHWLNLLVRGILATPLLNRTIANRILVIIVEGRKTGRRYKIPVGYTRSPWGLLVGTAGTWRRNLVDGKPVDIIVNRIRTTADAEVITDEKRCAERYRLILKHNPVHGRYAGIRADTEGNPVPDDLRVALSRAVAVVQLTPHA
jgi:hypothetical protein